MNTGLENFDIKCRDKYNVDDKQYSIPIEHADEVEALVSRCRNVGLKISRVQVFVRTFML